VAEGHRQRGGPVQEALAVMVALGHVRAGRASGHGEQGSAAKWTHSAMALAIRALGRGEGDGGSDPHAVLKMVERLLREGDARSGATAGDLGPEDARGLLRAWLAGVELDIAVESDLLAVLLERV